MYKTIVALVVFNAIIAVNAGVAAPIELQNQSLCVILDQKNGLPVIESCAWREDGKTIFASAAMPQGWEEWAIRETGDSAVWKIGEDENFTRAQWSGVLANGLTICWTVELPKQTPILRLSARVTNPANAPVAVKWFPVWSASWNLPDGLQWIRWWDSLSFQQVQKAPDAAKELTIASHLQSSDRPGQLPYWTLAASNARLFFGLEWTAGWRTEFQNGANQFSFRCFLPPEETQLTLQPGESIDGPVLNIVLSRETEEAQSRRDIMNKRLALSRLLYTSPDPILPLVYNHWYSCRFSFDGAYLKNQIPLLKSYGFDYFVVDAGWYPRVGEWIPDPAKFPNGEFESSLKTIQDGGVRVGIWSCPQYVSSASSAIPPVDNPVYYEKFIKGYLLDMAGMDFSQFLTDHVQTLRKNYFMNWWKYDQPLFTEQTRQGIMKNAIAFQNALKAVRKANPDLIVENCQSGGRIISEFTSLLSQSHWLKDGGSNGLSHARDNISVTLGAMDFLFPWSASRWTNNISQMDANDAELIRYYCRSAMPGVWGISDDLSKMPEKSKSIVLQEIERYRRLNALKMDCLYDLVLPGKGKPYTSVAYFDPSGDRAGALVFRWDQTSALDINIPMRLLNADQQFRCLDVDANTTREASGESLRQQGLSISLKTEQMSGLYFIGAK